MKLVTLLSKPPICIVMILLSPLAHPLDYALSTELGAEHSSNSNKQSSNGLRQWIYTPALSGRLAHSSDAVELDSDYFLQRRRVRKRKRSDW